MQRLDDFISQSCGKRFAHSLPDLKRNFGVLDIKKRRPGYYGMMGNTFRAYQGWEHSPSFIYNGWAEKALGSIDTQRLVKQIKSRSGFLNWHHSLYKTLESRWRYYEGGTPPLAHKLKMIDLFVKWLSAHDLGDAKINLALMENANCALDSQTLYMMNASYSNVLPLGKIFMGQIKTVESYNLCQELIDRFSRKFGGTRLLFDYFAYKRGAVPGYGLKKP